MKKALYVLTGLSVFGGVGTNMPFIMLNAVLPGSACARDGRLRVGDKLVQCDLNDLRGASQADALAVLQSCGKQVCRVLPQRYSIF